MSEGVQSSADPACARSQPARFRHRLGGSNSGRWGRAGASGIARRRHGRATPRRQARATARGSFTSPSAPAVSQHLAAALGRFVPSPSLCATVRLTASPMVIHRQDPALGSGSSAAKFAISAKRLGAASVACDSYDGAPAMQVADEREIFSMLDGASTARDRREASARPYRAEIARRSAPRSWFVEAKDGNVVPTARAPRRRLNRDAIRDLARRNAGPAHVALSVRGKPRELSRGGACTPVLPCVVKPSCPLPERGRAWRDRGGAGSSLGLCRRQHARRSGAVIVGGVHSYDMRSPCSPSATPGTSTYARRSAIVRSMANYRGKLAPMAMSMRRWGGAGDGARCGRCAWADTASSASSYSSPATRRSSPAQSPPA